jgi:DNA-binding response OmpR family regulator
MELLQMESNRAPSYRDGRLEIDFRTQTVLADGATVHLTPMEFGLLAHLARNAGEIVSRDTLMRNVWGYGPEILTRTMDVHLRRLRVKLGPYSRQHIETVFGLGYRLQPSSGVANCGAGCQLVATRRADC